jgi:hypothetical protein
VRALRLAASTKLTAGRALEAAPPPRFRRPAAVVVEQVAAVLEGRVDQTL